MIFLAQCQIPKQPQNFWRHSTRLIPLFILQWNSKKMADIPFSEGMYQNGCHLDTTVYRNPTDKGILLLYHSHVDARCKRSLLNTNTMLNRAFQLSSTWKFFHEECERLKEMFSRLRYPDDLVQSSIRRFIESKVPEDIPDWLIKEKPQSESCCPTRTGNLQT